MSRFRMGSVQPAIYKALVAMDQTIIESGIDEHLYELIKIRASQINGCAFCVDKHTADAIKQGENPRRLYLLGVWREAAKHFTEEELVVLEMTEEVTLIHQHGLRDAVYDKAIALFGKEKTAALIMAIGSINVWTRIGVATHLQPEF